MPIADQQAQPGPAPAGPVACGPGVARRRLAVELRRRREQAGLTLADAAGMLEWSAAKLSRLENAHVSLLPRDARLLAGIYRVRERDGGEGRELLIDLARQTRQKPWWSRYGLTVPEQYTAYAALEAEAELLRSYHPELVPLLLQIPAYSDAVGAGQAAGLLPARQQRLAEAGTPRLHVIVSEAVLRRPAGGPAVMAAQLDRLADASGTPDVIVQVLPFAAGAHPAMDTPFTLLTFPGPDPDIACPGPNPATCLAGTADVGHYQDAFAGLQHIALPPPASRDFITRAAADLMTGQGRPLAEAGTGS